jgi:hypothetical protein
VTPIRLPPFIPGIDHHRSMYFWEGAKMMLRAYLVLIPQEGYFSVE